MVERGQSVHAVFFLRLSELSVPGVSLDLAMQPKDDCATKYRVVHAPAGRILLADVPRPTAMDNRRPRPSFFFPR